ncbi:retrovirus-related pol polyprotein from transposon TNT 1-94 [Tanacetum coccineum]
MFDTVPPIPLPFGANTGNPSSPIRAGNPTDTINYPTTTNVVPNVDENLPQLLDSRGGSHVTNVPKFDEEDFSSWKDRSSSEFLADLNVEFHERGLLTNQRRFNKRSGRVGYQRKSVDKTNETYFACGKLGHFQKECPSLKTSTPSYPSSSKTYNKPKFLTNTTPQHNLNVNNNQKDYRVKYKGLKAEIAVLTKKIDAMSKGKSEKGLVAELFD